LLYATPHLPLASLGWAYFNKKSYDLAEKYYQEAIRLAPANFAFALRGLGLTYLETGRIKEAINALEKAVKSSPNIPEAAEAYLDLARAYARSHDNERALSAYRKSLSSCRQAPLPRNQKKKPKSCGAKCHMAKLICGNVAPPRASLSSTAVGYRNTGRSDDPFWRCH